MKTIAKMFALLLAALSFSVATRAEDQPKTLTYDVVLIAQGDSIIQTIKIVREATPGMGLTEAMNLVKGAPKTVKTGATKEEGEKLIKALDAQHAKAEMRDATGKVVAATTVVPVVAGTFDLVLKSAKDIETKIYVIKIARDLTGLGLAECKKLVESAPVTLKSGMSNEDAQKYKRILEENKAEVEVKESGK